MKGGSNLPCRVKLSQVLAEHGLLLEGVQKGLALAQLVVLPHQPRKEIGNAGVVGQHQARHAVGVWQVW